MAQILFRFSGLFGRKPAVAAAGDAFDRLGRIVREERAREGRARPCRLIPAH